MKILLAIESPPDMSSLPLDNPTIGHVTSRRHRDNNTEQHVTGASRRQVNIFTKRSQNCQHYVFHYDNEKYF